jgi:hypothetical protein
MEVKHWEILEPNRKDFVTEEEFLAALMDRTRELVVKFNPMAFSASLLMSGKPGPTSVIAFNTNYYNKQKPIGVFRHDSPTKWNPGPWLPSRGLRPKMKISGATIEAGPLLVRDGKVYEYGVSEGQFRPDATRRADHIAGGWTEHDKFIVGFFPNASLGEMAKKLIKHGVVEGMKMDGGHSCYLKVGIVKRGAPVVYCGIELRERKHA